ncbi:MAG: ATP-dependent RecD-like DNA helicase [Solobacterium sp.]|nr:ATP-dependent RecD-like DNA helicase [Solobacterium sp.]
MSEERSLDELTVITGKITYVVYHNEETFYSVFRFMINDENERVITVTGLFPSFETDVIYRLYGNYIEHPRYGMQFQITSYEQPLPSEAEAVIRYLSGIQFPGIGKKTAEKIVSTLGENCLDLIREDENVLRMVPGLKEDKILVILEGIAQSDTGMEELIRFLNIHGIGMRNLIRLNKTYGKEALDKIRENPYRVIDECDGFGFKTADKIAQSLGFSADDERRLYAYLVSLCMDLCVASGDSFVTYTTLQEAFAKRCTGLSYDYDTLFSTAVNNRKFAAEEERVYPITQYEAEEGISSFLAGFPYTELDPFHEELLEEYLEQMQKSLAITYDEDQIRAIHSFFTHPFMILTGGPGTGKTTVVRALVQLFKMLYPSSTVVCAAPTGRAAKRLSELTDNPAMTVHSLLKWDLETNTFGVNEDEPIFADLLIVDEFSMVDNWLFYHLLQASRLVRKICIIGDEDQLPSVSCGSVLRDLIQSDCFPLVRLTHIYRQQTGSDVIELAHMIHEGNVDFESLNHDFLFLEKPSEEVRRTIVQITANALEKGYTLNDIQVLSPMYNGNAGIDILNRALQETFNPRTPDKKEMKFGYLIFREGDKILQLKNQPDDDVYNGDIGVLEEIIDARFTETHQTTLIVNFDGIYVEYAGENLSNITLAYCISVHKSQGSEYPIVILPITPQHTIMLQRKLIYTGVTRARQSLILIGDKRAFLRGIAQIERHYRQTTLCRRIMEKTGKNV